ncbi:RAM signaling pathway protein-domain containing protein [Rhodotorula toruloides]|uniref:RAM signaling pathway protein-domain containing protein n=1 Tax=Rhodotorula toruloides TaxID=5286 RepID=A0A2T0AEM6_RHOTO|nr:RAM signaling pathway protein-domain containing protein [Rhodotorula toruloides]
MPSRHASQTSVSSVASDNSLGFLGPHDSMIPTDEGAFGALRRELSATEPLNGLGVSEEDRPPPGSSSRPGRFYDEPEQVDTLRGRPSYEIGRPDADQDVETLGRPASIEVDGSMSFLLSPPPAALDLATPNSQAKAKDRRPGDRSFPAPLLLKSDRSYSSGGGNANAATSPYFPPTAPLSIPRRPSASTSIGGSSSTSVSPAGPPGRDWSRREGTGQSSSSGESSRSTLPYQRHRHQQSSTSSLSHGSYLPYNSSYSYEPRQLAPSSSSTPPSSSSSRPGTQPSQPSENASSAPPPPFSTSSTTPPGTSSEPPISSQALLLHVLALRSAASPMALSQSQGPLSRSGTPLAAGAPSHQRIRSAGSTAADSDATTAPAEDRNAARQSTYHGGPKLDTVDLSHKRIAEVPLEVVEELKDEVEKLALGYNLLKDLPPHFGELGNRLKYLNIRVNLLTTFPAVLCSMPSIEILDISRNKIRKLPANPGTLVNLKVLSIAKNRIKRLPVWFTTMSHLKVLKLDHNPLEWPPRDVATFSPSIAGQPMSKQEEADEMQRWLPALMTWMRDHQDSDEDERQSSEGRIPRTTRLPTSGSGHMPQNSLTAILEPVAPLRLPSTSPSSSNARLAPDLLEADPSARHSRNASHSTAQSGNLTPLSSLRAKKSLPDLRQSHADILAERRTGPGLDAGAEPALPNLDNLPRGLLDGHVHPPIARSLSARPSTASDDRDVSTSSDSTATPARPNPIMRSESARPMARSVADPALARRQATLAPGRLVLQVEADSAGRVKRAEVSRPTPAESERSSGAYFRRMSMLPVSTISKTVPVALLQFADAIRGILFSLSQVFSALRQFVVFAAQDRLPPPIARIMSVADTTMTALINALDRFDSVSRRGTPPALIIRDVFSSCRNSVAAFGELVTAIQPQLASLTVSADLRYTRTLLLMLYGAVGEVANSWSAVAPLITDIDDPSLATLVLQPPTPSPTIEPSAQIEPGPRLTRQRSVTRRHAGSFSVEDVQLGANLPPADIPPVPSLPGGPLVLDEGASANEASGGSTLRARPPMSAKSSTSSTGSFSTSRAAPPPPLAMPPQLGYEAMAQKAFEHPITPGGMGLFDRAGDSRALSRQNSFSASVPPVPAIPTGAGSAMPASYHPHRVSRPVSTLNADETFVDQADSTISIASDVYGMLLDSFEDPAMSEQFADIDSRRMDELVDLCKAGHETTQRLRRAVERVRGNDGRGRLKFTTSDARKLGDASFDFVQNVIRSAKLIKSISQDFPFPLQMREAVGQLTLGTREFARLLSHAQTSFRPSQVVAREEKAAGSANGGAGRDAGSLDAKAAGGGPAGRV